jgi:hypothetical protein
VRTLQLRHDYKDWAKKLKHPDESHVRYVINGHDTVARAPDESTVAVLLDERIDPVLYRAAYEVWQHVDGSLETRTKALGIDRMHKSMNKEGVRSNFTGVNVHYRRELKKQGKHDATLGIYGKDCLKTRQTVKHPDWLGGNSMLIKRVNGLFKKYLPTHYTEQRATVKNNPSCRTGPLRDTAFSTLYVLKGLSVHYHRDNNWRGGMTALMCCGKFVGGTLVIPRWKLGIVFRPGDLILFNAEDLHGLLPFDGQRISGAFFCSKHIS